MVAKEVLPVVCRAEVEAPVGKAEEFTTTPLVVPGVVWEI